MIPDRHERSNTDGCGSPVSEATLRENLGETSGIIFFDGDCRFCRYVLKRLLRRDPAGRLKLCNVRSKIGRAVMEGLGRRPENTFGFLTKERMHLDVSAYRHLLASKALRAPLASAALSVTPAFLSHTVYKQIARNRPTLSRLVPATADLTFPIERFIASGT